MFMGILSIATVPVQQENLTETLVSADNSCLWVL